jgi:signal transduction histidine kinase
VAAFGVAAIIKRFKRRAGSIHISKKVFILLFAGAATGLITLAALVVKSNDAITESARKLMVIVTIIAAFSYNAACLLIIILSESRDNYKALSLINQKIIESQQKYYTLVNEKQQEIRSIRHEMKNHLACINSLYQTGKLKEMEEYISQLTAAADDTKELFDTGNDIVNAILNDAESRYEKEHIKIRLQGGFPEHLQIAPMDLCIIFANLVSNAAEAILRMERLQQNTDYIDIKISSFKDDLYKDIQNPTGNNTEIQNGKLITSKSDKSHHGFGVANIIQRVEKYQGEVIFKIIDSRFMAEINMKNSVQIS